MGISLYEHDGRFYTHYVDSRDACASWNPWRNNDDAFAVAVALDVFPNMADIRKKIKEKGGDPQDLARRSICCRAADKGLFVL